MTLTEAAFMRGGLPESTHALLWCVTDASGAVVAESVAGASTTQVFARSTVKPFQALPAVRAGVMQRFGLTDRHIAIACASHGGTEEHLSAVLEILAACGCAEADLACGPLEPLDAAAADRLRARGALPGRLTHNCSGKHALALALCRQEDWPAAGYLETSHPLAVVMRAAVAEAAGAVPDALPAGTDGCGMPTFHLPLVAIATAFGRLAGGDMGEDGTRVADAMRSHPQLVAFDGAIDTELMRAVPGLVAKVGAEGLLAIGLEDGRGLALKVIDGAKRAVDPAGVAAVRVLLGRTASGEALDRLARPEIRNSLGVVVGHGEARV